MQRKLDAFKELLEIMDELRAKCPWDMKQTLESLRKLTIEETYELGDAILKNDLQEIKKELGDLMLHIVFYAKIGDEKGEFDMADVLEGINKKLMGILIDIDKIEVAEGIPLYNNNKIAGELRSAIYSPNLKKVVGIAMIKKEHWDKKTPIELKIRDKKCKGTLCDLPIV